MSDSLLITTKALDLDQDWSMRLQTACQLEGVEYTRHFGVTVTYALSGDMELRDDGTVNFEGVDDAAIITTINEHKPKPPALQPSLIAARLVVNENYKDRVKVVCVAEQYIYSHELALAVAEGLARKGDHIDVSVNGHVSVEKLPDNALKSAVTTQWKSLFKELYETEEENNNGVPE